MNPAPEGRESLPGGETVGDNFTSFPRKHPWISGKFFFQDESCAAPARFVYHVVEDLANDVHSDAAGPDIFEIPAAYALWIARPPIVT